MNEKENAKLKVKAIMDKMGYSTAELLKKKLNDYYIIYLHSPEELHAKYEGIPYFVLWNGDEVRPATHKERLEIIGIYQYSDK